MKAWLTTAGPYRVERIECPGPGGTVTLSAPRAGVVHTTQGSFESALAVFRQRYAPTFLIGPHRIAQLLELGAVCGALENHEGGVETNRIAAVQIEVAGFSQERPYTFGKGTDDPLAALLGALRIEVGIPLSRPFPDAMPPGGSNVWARESFARRSAGKWGTTPGWFGHVEIPENSHWDPGALQWAKIFARAKQLDSYGPKRQAALRKWILAKHAAGWPWEKIKATANFKEFKDLGGT